MSLKHERKRTGFVAFWCLLVVFSVLMIWIKPWDSLVSYAVPRQTALSTSYDEVYNNRFVSQTFFPKHSFDTIEVFLATDEGAPENTFTVTLSAEDGEVVQEWEILTSSVPNNWMKLKLDARANGTILYRLIIRAPEIEKENPILVCTRFGSMSETETFYRNGTPVGRTLCFSACQSYPNLFAIGGYFFFFATAVVWWLRRKKPVEANATVLLLGLGISMMLVIAPFAGPDEDYHYNSSLVLSNIIMGRDDPYTYEAEYYDFSGFMLHHNANSAFVRVLQDVKGDPVDKTLGTIDGWDRMNNLDDPLPYLASAIGLSVGRVLGLNFVYTHYLARFCNLILYTILVTLAVRLIPQRKELLLLIALLPISLQQATSLSRDVLLNAAALLLVAYVLRLCVDDRKITYRDIGILTILCAIMVPNKLVYAPLGLIVFAIPKDHFRSSGTRLRMLAVIFTGMFLVLIATNMQTILKVLDSGEGGVAAVTYDNVTRAQYTVPYAIRHPRTFLMLLLTSMYTQIYSWVAGSLGLYLAGLNLVLSDWVLFGMLILLADATIMKKNEQPLLNRKQSMILILSCAITFMLLMVAAFTWTPLGAKFIAGIQGRYFIPLMLPILFCIGSKRISLNIEQRNVFYLFWFVELLVINGVTNQVVF